jgi:hypothetical protein
VGKSQRNGREITREQRLIHENQRLKRQLSLLRKQVARIDLDRYSSLRDIVDQHYQEDRAQEGQDLLDKLKQEWKCRQPNCEGYLEIILYTKVDHIWYYRKCNCCPHRTKAQKYVSSEVKGIVKKSE